MTIRVNSQLVPAGNFPIVADTDTKGGFRVITWENSDGYADAAAAVLDKVPSDRRSDYMVVRALNTDTLDVQEFEWDGADFNLWSPRNATVRALYGVLSMTKSVSGGSLNTFDITATLFDGFGKRHVVTKAITSVAATGQFVFFDSDAEDIDTAAAIGLNDQRDVPLFYIGRTTGGAISKIVPCYPMSRGDWDFRSVTVGDGDLYHFDNLKSAALFMSFFGSGDTAPRRILLSGDNGNAERAMTGTVNVTSGGTAVTTGTTPTRFISEYQAGDFIIIASQHCKIASLTSSTITLASAFPGATQVNAAHTRGSYAGPNSDAVNTAMPEFAGANLDDVTVSGATPSGSLIGAHARAYIAWGKNTVSIEPMFNIGSADMNGWRFENIDFSVTALKDTGRDLNCLFANIPGSWSFEQCRFVNGTDNSATQKATNIFLWDTLEYVGADITDGDEGQLGLSFEDCVFYKAGGGAGTSIFKHKFITTSTTVTYSFRDCRIVGSSGTDNNYVETICNIDTANADITWAGGKISGVNLSLFQVADAESARVRMRDVYVDNFPDGLTVSNVQSSLNNVVFAGNDVSLSGVVLAINVTGSFTDVDSTVSIGTESIVGDLSINQAEIELLKSITADLTDIETDLVAAEARISVIESKKIIMFAGLSPYSAGTGAGAKAFAGTKIIFPDGTLGTVASDHQLNMLATNGLHGALGIADTVYYFYLTKTSGVAGNTTGLTYSTAAPNAAGSPSSGSVGGVSYRYVGMLMTKIDSVGDSDMWTPSAAVNYCNGMRKVFFGQHELSGMWKQMQKLGATGANATDMDDFDLLDDFPTALSLSLMISTSSGYTISDGASITYHLPDGTTSSDQVYTTATSHIQYIKTELIRQFVTPEFGITKINQSNATLNIYTVGLEEDIERPIPLLGG